jgi:hypothetical protein
VSYWQQDGLPLFGVTGNRTYIFGDLAQADVAALNVTFAVTPFGEIVRNGRVHLPGVLRAAAAVQEHKALNGVSNGSSAAFGSSAGSSSGAEEIAPRTVFAIDTSGRLVLVAVDGVERLNLGLTMTETAEIFANQTPGFPLGGSVQSAFNVDGGGSTTMSKALADVLSVQVYNRPTSTDFGDVVERLVTSIACISGAL